MLSDVYKLHALLPNVMYEMMYNDDEETANCPNMHSLLVIS